MTNCASDCEYEPTATDCEFFGEHGWWVSPPIISTETLDDAFAGAMRHYAGERDYPLLLAGGYLDWRPEHGNRLRLNDYVSLQNEGIRQLVLQPVLGRIAAMLVNTTRIRLFHDQLVLKPAGVKDGSAIGWHVDAAYWKTCSSRRMLTAWIPFQDCDAEMGCISFLDKSHLLLGTEWMSTFNEHDMASLERRLGESVACSKVHLKMKRGQVSFHHCLTIHGSEANKGERDRIALAVHMQDDSNTYVAQLDRAGRRLVHVNDLMCRQRQDGTPDYGDPDICPILWAATD